MDELFIKIIPLAAYAICVHMIIGFFNFWLIPHRSFVKDVRNIKFKTTNTKGSESPLSEIPNLTFAAAKKQKELIENAKLTMLEKLGIPVLKILVGISTASLVLGCILYYSPLSEAINEYAQDNNQYPIKFIGNGFIVFSLITHSAFIFFLARFDIMGILVEYHEDYKDKSTLPLILKMF